MPIADLLPFWQTLSEADRMLLQKHAQSAFVTAGAVFRETAGEAPGVMAVKSGRLRVYILSSNGRELTLYRLQAGEICILPASCLLPDLPFEVMVEAERETALWILPSSILRDLAGRCLPVASWSSRLLADRLATVTACISQLLWKNLDSRLAAFLLEESRMEQSPMLRLTHERLAGHLGTAREVVTRILHQLQRDGLIRLTRGSVELLDPEGLRRLASL